jgi:hypothetical protein
VRAQTKRNPEELEKKITATAYAGNMQRKYSLAITDLYSELPEFAVHSEAARRGPNAP